MNRKFLHASLRNKSSVSRPNVKCREEVAAFDSCQVGDVSEELEAHRDPTAGLLIAPVVVGPVIREHGHRRERVLLDELQRYPNL